MELIVLMGLQASGKTTFRERRFKLPHVAMGLGAMGGAQEAQEREHKSLVEALADRRTIVVDSTNICRADREHYIGPARAAGYRVIGYYFRSDLKESLARNAGRPVHQRVPDVALKATVKKLQRPSKKEGFDELYYVYIDRQGNFVVDPYRETEAEEEP